MTTRKTNRRPESFNALTGRFEYTEAQARETADNLTRWHRETIARHAAEEGLTVAEYEARDPFATFA